MLDFVHLALFMATLCIGKFCFYIIRHGSNMAGWSRVNPGLEQCRGRALSLGTSLRTAAHYI